MDVYSDTHNNNKHTYTHNKYIYNECILDTPIDIICRHRLIYSIKSQLYAKKIDEAEVPIFDLIECFTTTFLRAHSWLNWVDEDDDEDEVGLKEKPEDTRYIKKITSK